MSAFDFSEIRGARREQRLMTVAGALAAAVTALAISAMAVLVLPATAAQAAPAPSTGSSYAWGSNGFGLVGDGTTTDVHSPQPSWGADDFTQVSIGVDRAVALDAHGDAWAWGRNFDSTNPLGGDLGVGPGQPDVVTAPQRVAMPAGVAFRQVAAGDDAILAIDGDGRVWAWGNDTFGLCGSDDCSSRPALLSSLSGFTASSVHLGDHAYYAVDAADGALWAWGSNLEGQLGRGPGGNGLDVCSPSTPTVPAPVEVGGSPLVLTSFSTFSNTAVGIDGEGRLWGWGQNNMGQLGFGAGKDSQGFNQPEEVCGPTQLGPQVGGATDTSFRAKLASTAGAQTIVVGTDGTVWSFGSNDEGQLGRTTPGGDFDADWGRVAMPAGVSSYTRLATGWWYTLAVGTDGRLYGWGANDAGQLGDGSTGQTVTPVAVDLPAGAVVDAVQAGVSTSSVQLTAPSGAGIAADDDQLIAPAPADVHPVAAVVVPVALVLIAGGIALTIVLIRRRRGARI